MKTVTIPSKKFSFAGGKDLALPNGIFARNESVSLDSIHTAILYRNLLIVDFDGGTLHIVGPFDDRHQRFIDALKTNADCQYEEIDAKLKLRPENRVASIIFYVVFSIAIALSIFLISLSDDHETQPITFLFYLLPAFCIAFLTKHGLLTVAGVVGQKFRRDQE